MLPFRPLDHLWLLALAAIACLAFVVFPAMLFAADAAADAYLWHPSATQDGGYALFFGADQVGYYDGRKYYPLLAPGRLGGPCDPPAELPAGARGTTNFGIDRRRFHPGPRITFRGEEVSREQALRLITQGVPDDAGKPRLTVIGPEAERKQVLDDLAASPALAALKDRFVVQGYAPDDPLIAGLGFVTAGKPTIYAQAPDGKVLHRQDSYQGAEKLAQALRVINPNYQPQADPDLLRAPAIPGLSGLPPVAWLLAALGTVLALFGRPVTANGVKP